MAFVMTDLDVAKEVNYAIRVLKDFSKYYSGTISPDCVHVMNAQEHEWRKCA